MLQCKIAITYLAMVNFKLIISHFSHIMQSLLHVICMEIHLRRHTVPALVQIHKEYLTRRSRNGQDKEHLFYFLIQNT